MRPLASLALLALFVGCAPTSVIVDGKKVPRLDLDYVGQPYVVRVSSAYPKPGSPSGGLVASGGRVSGNVCGLDITYDVEHDRDYVQLEGFVGDGNMESHLKVRDIGGVIRRITGTLDSRGTGINLDLRKNSIRGTVGLRRFDLGRDGDRYIGSLSITQAVTTAATVNGAAALWEMPPATQAAVLPALLTCHGDELEGNNRGSFTVGFGGHQTWEGNHVSAVYHSMTGDQRRMFIQNQSGSPPPP